MSNLGKLCPPLRRFGVRLESIEQAGETGISLLSCIVVSSILSNSKDKCGRLLAGVMNPATSLPLTPRLLGEPSKAGVTNARGPAGESLWKFGVDRAFTAEL